MRYSTLRPLWEHVTNQSLDLATDAKNGSPEAHLYGALHDLFVGDPVFDPSRGRETSEVLFLAPALGKRVLGSAGDVPQRAGDCMQIQFKLW